MDRHLNISIDIVLMYVRQVVYTLSFVHFCVALQFTERWQKACPVCFLYFTKAQSFVDIVSAHTLK